MAKPTDKDAARRALRDVAATQDRARALSFYRSAFAPVMVWGFVWLICNTVSFFQPGLANTIWIVGIFLGSIASVASGWVRRDRDRQNQARHDGTGLARHVMIGIGIAVIIVLGLTALGFLDVFSSSQQANAMISVMVAISYGVAGLQHGLRLTLLGLVVGAAAVGGYIWLREWYELWMGIVGGGSLILGAIWLWRS